MAPPTTLREGKPPSAVGCINVVSNALTTKFDDQNRSPVCRSVGPGSAGLGSVGLGSAGPGSAGLGSVGLGMLAQAVSGWVVSV